MPLFSYLDTFSIGGLRGSNEPTPPAINILGVSKTLLPVVLSFHKSPVFIISSILSLRWNGVLNGLICFCKFSINDNPVHSGSAGIS